MTALVIPSSLFEHSKSLTARGYYAMELFHGQSSFQLPGCSMVNSWETLALQVSHTEEAIQDLVIAVGFLHHARGPDPPNAATPTLDPNQYNYALWHYSRAVSGIRKSVELARKDQTSVEIVLLACIMFLSFEILQGSYGNALRHRNTGLEILGEYLGSDGQQAGDGRSKVRLSRRPTSAIEILCQAFNCLDYDLSMAGSLEPKLHATCIEDGTGFPTVFEDFDHARMHLNVITNATFRMRGELERRAKEEMRASGLGMQNSNLVHCWSQSRAAVMSVDDLPVLASQLREIEQNVSRWSSAFASMSLPPSETMNVMRMMLQLQFMVTWVSSSIWNGASEMRSDRFLPVFRQTLATIDKLITLRPDSRRSALEQGDKASQWALTGRGSGIIMALYLVAYKCRDSILRWRALALFERLKMQEGLLSTGLVAPCVREIVLLEEDEARRITGTPSNQPLTCKDVPERARFIEVSINADNSDAGTGGLVFSRRKEGWPGFEIGEHWFTIPSQDHVDTTLEAGSMF